MNTACVLPSQRRVNGMYCLIQMAYWAMSRTHSHQGVIALAAVREYASVEDLLRAAADRGEPPLLVICDEISDPHNLGAIIRTAECAGAHGVIIPKRRSAGLTAVVGKTSAGAVAHAGQEGHRGQGTGLRRHRRHRQDGEGQDRRHIVRSPQGGGTEGNLLRGALLFRGHRPQDPRSGGQDCPGPDPHVSLKMVYIIFAVLRDSTPYLPAI